MILRPPAPMRTIHAGALTLEPQSVAHAGEMFAVLRDPAIYTYENAPPRSVEWLRARFGKLESRRSADASEQWLNWVVRMPTTELAGYVQATVHRDDSANIAYVFSSAYWGKGLASCATRAMIDELVRSYQVRLLFAVAKAANFRSVRMLERLGFLPAKPEIHAAQQAEPDEVLLFREVGPA